MFLTPVSSLVLDRTDAHNAHYKNIFLFPQIPTDLPSPSSHRIPQTVVFCFWNRVELRNLWRFWGAWCRWLSCLLRPHCQETKPQRVYYVICSDCFVVTSWNWFPRKLSAVTVTPQNCIPSRLFLVYVFLQCYQLISLMINNCCSHGPPLQSTIPRYVTSHLWNLGVSHSKSMQISID